MSIRHYGIEPPAHNASSYSNYGCRCQICRTAEAERKRTLKARRLTRTEIPPDAHGRYTTYSNWLCRCAPCRRAWADYRQELRTR